MSEKKDCEKIKEELINIYLAIKLRKEEDVNKILISNIYNIIFYRLKKYQKK